MKKYVKRTTVSNNDDGQQALREGIAAAYLDHANLVADLGHADLAQNSRRRADKWGGPGLKKAVVSTKVKKGGSGLDVAFVPDSIFSEDGIPLSSPWVFPEPDGRLADTPQLVSCLDLLKQGPDELPEDALDPIARKWLEETRKNTEEIQRLEALATDLLREYTKDGVKNKKAVAEVVCLVPILGKDNYRFLLSQFLKDIEGSRILDFGILNGLAQTLQGSPSPDYLYSQDLIEVLTTISVRLQETHEQSKDHIFELTVAVTKVLDAMADTKVTGLNREELHGPLLAFLGGLQGSEDPHLKYYASYAFQALLCVPDDESPWQATVRRTTKVIRGISGLVSAAKGLDLNGFMDGLQNIQQGFEGLSQVVDLAKMAYEGVSSVYEGEQDLVESLKEGLTFNRKRAWYAALRGTDTLIEGRELAKFKTLVCGAACRRELAFQWGVCQRLGNIAASSSWDSYTRQSAIVFLGEIYRDDRAWSQLAPIKVYIIDILKQLSKTNDSQQAISLLKDLATDGNATKQDIYRSYATSEPSPHLLKPGRLEFASPSLMDRVQRRTDVEADLRRICRSRIKERGGSIYVTPLARTHLQSSDETSFPLMPMVEEFLLSNDKVLLLLGDSGAGKSTFNLELECKLWNAYKSKTARIPLFINLPAIDRPERDLIVKHLRICEFTEPQIRELKDREFVIICDGYDESQQTSNLYESNGLNKEGGWKAKMIISCRSEHLGEDYRDRFQPARVNSSDPDLFRQAVIVPFSEDQVKEYISQYVSIKKSLWAVSDYVEVLDQIPSLQDLVKNPFLLTLSLDVLPRITDPGQKLASNKITRVQLYDEFVAQWLERNKKRLATQELNEQEKKAFESLSEEGFTQQGLIFLKELSAAIYTEQEGNPVVDYSRARDVGSWKEQFFGHKDEEAQLLRNAIPMARKGTRFGFVHRSILEYGVSRAIYEPQQQKGLKLEPAETESKGVTELMLPKNIETSLQQGPNPDSPIVKRNFIKHPSVMQFLVERVQSESALKDQLMAYIHVSKTDNKWRMAAANAITILVRAGIRLSGLDLRGVKVPRADLSNGIFDSTQLQGADLRRTNLQGAWLRQADLTDARMDAAMFGQLPTLSDDIFKGPFVFFSDEKTFLATTMDGRMLLYDTTTWMAPTPLGSDDDRARCLALSRDGSTLVTGGDNNVKVWDARDTNKIQLFYTLEGHTGTIWDVAVSQNGEYALSSSDDQTVRLWNAKTGLLEHIFDRREGHKDGTIVPEDTNMNDDIQGLEYSPDGTVFACSYRDGSLVIWDCESRSCLHDLEVSYENSPGIVFSPNSKQLASFGDGDPFIKIWDVVTGTSLRELKGSEVSFNTVSYSPNGQQIASADGDGIIRLWNVVTGASDHVLNGNSGSINSLVYSPDGRLIATAGSDMSVRIWNALTGDPGPAFNGHTQQLNELVFSPDGLTIVSSSYDYTIRLWDTRAPAISSDRQSIWHPDSAYEVRYLSDGQHIATFSKSLVLVWNKESGWGHESFTASGYFIAGCTLSPDGGHIVILGQDRSVRLYDTQSGQCLNVLQESLDPQPEQPDDDSYCQCDMAMSSDGCWIAANGGMGLVLVWNQHTGAVERRLEGHSRVVRRFFFSSSPGKEHILVTTSNDATVRLWDVLTGQCIHVLTGHDKPVVAISFLVNGTRIASASEDCTIRLWDTTTGEPVWMVDTGCNSNMTFSHDGTRLVIGKETEDYNTILQIWDTLKGEQLWVLGEHGFYPSVSFSPDDQLLITTSDRSARLWDLNTRQLVGKLDNLRDEASAFGWGDVTTSTSTSGTRGIRPITIGHRGGAVSLWHIVDLDNNHQKYSSSTMEVSNGVEVAMVDSFTDNIRDDTLCKKYEFLLQWSTEFERFNAEGAVITGVKGLSRITTRLLKQNGACGEPMSNLRHTVNKVMNANLLSHIKTMDLTKDAQESDQSGSTAAVDNALPRPSKIEAIVKGALLKRHMTIPIEE
ncbi:hypothetical protein BGZ49_001339 [Haplosporangium sp. Z 27]|nr:hypothetical protein BGZ49_001339 [Haplosporangium sp. Z 27]